ncbi:TonB family protein [bacterium]|nr:TonB family protein [bacterium]
MKPLKPRSKNQSILFDDETLKISFKVDKNERVPIHNSDKLRLRVTVLAFNQIVDDSLLQKNELLYFGAHKKAAVKLPSDYISKKLDLLKLNTDGTITLKITPDASGYLEYGDQLTAVEDQVGIDKKNYKESTLPIGSKGFLVYDTVIIYFETVSQDETAIPFSWRQQIKDPYFVRWFAVSAAIHLALFILAYVMPKPDLEDKTEKIRKQYKKIVVQNKEMKKYQPAIVRSKKLRGNVGKEGSGAKAGGKEGRRGRGVKGRTGKKTNRVDVNKTGVLSFFSKNNNSVLNDLIGSGSNITESIDKLGSKNARHGLPGETTVREGKGIRGSASGGGNNTASIGQGLGTKGKGGGNKNMGGLSDFGTGKKNVAVSASIDDEEVYIQGNIPKDVIARIIRNHLGQIRSCYERQVIRQPKLRGKIVVRFVIGLQGRVTSTSIAETGMNNAAVEGCIQRVVRRMPFPKPGGGVVEVVYPFTFNLAT